MKLNLDLTKLLLVMLIIKLSKARPTPEVATSTEALTPALGSNSFNKDYLAMQVYQSVQKGDGFLTLLRNRFIDDIMDGVAEGICEGTLAPLIAALIEPMISTSGTVAIQKLLQFAKDEIDKTKWKMNQERNINYEIQPVDIDGRGSFLMLSSTAKVKTVAENINKINDVKNYGNTTGSITETHSDIKRINDTIELVNVDVKYINDTINKDYNGANFDIKTDVDDTISSITDDVEISQPANDSNYVESPAKYVENETTTIANNDNLELTAAVSTDLFDVDMSDNEVKKRDIDDSFEVIHLENVFLIPISNVNGKEQGSLSVDKALEVGMKIRELREEVRMNSCRMVVELLEDAVKKLEFQ